MPPRCLAMAKSFALAGIPLFPVWHASPAGCGCGNPACAHPGKHPIGRLVPTGSNEATIEEDQIDEWFQKHPEANFGLRFGGKSRAVGLDVDGAEGKAELGRLISMHGPLPPTFQVRSGGGGMHYYFECDEELRTGKIGAGLELKAENGTLTGPSSRHASGNLYLSNAKNGFNRRLLAPLPSWIAELSRAPRPKALPRWMLNHDPLLEGERNNGLMSLAGSLRSSGRDEAGVLEGLVELNELLCDPPLDHEELRSIAASVARYPSAKGDGSNIATKVLEISESIEFFHNGNRDGFATITVNDHKETWPLKSGFFRDWLSRSFLNQFDTVPSASALEDALAIFRCKALDGPCQEAYVRVAQDESGIWLDLCDNQWRVVQITANGWKVHEGSCSRRFVRSSGMRPLPEPARGGQLLELRKFINLASDSDWTLTASWLVSALRPNAPCPLLFPNGEQGSAKSTACRVLKALIDPSCPESRSEPRDERDLVIAASGNWLLSFDNVSSISPWLSDALCRIATGGGFGTRMLFTDDTEKLFNVRRPVLANGIEEIAHRSDLLDRSISVTLPTIPSERRKPEEQFWAEFNSARPRILGALLDAVSCALRRLPEVHIPNLPRMADFARWAVAAEPALCVDPGDVMKAYNKNRAHTHDAAIEASPIGPAVEQLMQRDPDWEGTAAGLLKRLATSLPTGAGVPKTARAMSGALKRIAPNLRHLGIDVEFLGKQGRGGIRVIRIRSKVR